MKLLRKLYHTGQRFAIDMQSSGTGKVLRVTQTPKKTGVLLHLQKRLM